MLAVDIIFIMHTTLDSAGITQEESGNQKTKLNAEPRGNTNINESEKEGIQRK